MTRAKAVTAAVVFTALASVLLLLVPTINSGFLSEDFLDLHHTFSPESFTRFVFTGFRPLNQAVFAMDASLWGETRPWGWHLTNILLHVLCAFLLWRTAIAVFRDKSFAALSVAFFLLSQAAVPSFARISGRTTPVAVAPLLGAIIAHAAFVTQRKKRYLILGMTLFLASLFAKETALACAPLFGLVSMYLVPPAKPRCFIRHTALYLVPTFIYLAWRIYWLGLTLGYSESAGFGLFMINNLITLLKMQFSPWLDGLPVRILLVLGMVPLLATKAHWRLKLLLVGFIILPLLTVANLPPRSYYAYAALPGAALLFGAAAGSLEGRSRFLIPVILLGCFLSSRDELARFRQADSYTRAMIDRLADLKGDYPDSSLIFVSGIRSGVAGYGTIWPGAYGEALSTIGVDGSGVFDETSFWEETWPIIDAGGDPECLFADLSKDPTEVLPFRPSLRFDSLGHDSMVVIDGEILPISEALWKMNSCLATGRCRLFVSDPFEEDLWVEIQPASTTGDTISFDLESSPAWLLSRDTGGYLHVTGPGSTTDLRFSRERLWLTPLLERLERKAEARR